MRFEENKVKETYFDKYEGIQSEISQVTRFDENTNLSMTYLGKRGQTRKSVIRAEGQFYLVLKLKFVRNGASLDTVNNTQETVIFDPNQILGILDLRSLGYYKMKQGVLQQNLSKIIILSP